MQNCLILGVSTWGLHSCICKDFIVYEATNFHSPLWFSPKSYCWWESWSSERADAFPKIAAYISHLQTTQYKPATTPSYIYSRSTICIFFFFLLSAYICLLRTLFIYCCLSQNMSSLRRGALLSHARLNPQHLASCRPLGSICWRNEWRTAGGIAEQNHSVRATEILGCIPARSPTSWPWAIGFLSLISEMKILSPLSYHCGEKNKIKSINHLAPCLLIVYTEQMLAVTHLRRGDLWGLVQNPSCHGVCISRDCEKQL